VAALLRVPGTGTVAPVRSRRYGRDVLAGDWRRHGRRPPAREVEAEPDLVVEDAETGWCGAVVAVEKGPGGVVVSLEDRHGRRKAFPLGPGFLVDGEPVVLVRPQAPAAPQRPGRTASGSVAVHGQRARVARGSRLFVEGRHDAELVERVWGDDLRVEGVVVEYLAGADDLPEIVRSFAPDRARRLGVLLDHLVPGSKESRLAARVTSPHVLVVGHPYVDVWQAVKPSALGIEAWPDVPRGVPWKEGVCDALGWPRDTAAAWRRVLAAVDSYADLEPALLGRVEELIDFVTAP
jgi:hypothetical protein